MLRQFRVVATGGLLVSLVLAGCSRRGEQRGPQGEAAQPSRQPGGMMGDGMMSGMMRGAADTGAAPRPQAVAASAPDCPAPSQRLVDAGRALFSGTGNCFGCHGSNAQGSAVAPDLTDSTWLDVDGSYARIADLVRSGVPHPQRFPAAMPPMGGAQLDSLQVCAVAAYVYALGR